MKPKDMPKQKCPECERRKQIDDLVDSLLHDSPLVMREAKPLLGYFMRLAVQEWEERYKDIPF